MDQKKKNGGEIHNCINNYNGSLIDKLEDDLELFSSNFVLLPEQVNKVVSLVTYITITLF